MLASIRFYFTLIHIKTEITDCTKNYNKINAFIFFAKALSICNQQVWIPRFYITPDLLERECYLEQHVSSV